MTMLAETNSQNRPKQPSLRAGVSSASGNEQELALAGHRSSGSASPSTGCHSSEGSPSSMSPWNQAASPFSKSPWSHASPPRDFLPPPPQKSVVATLVGSLLREEGHIYSIAAARGLLYTGSDSRNIRVWKEEKEFAGFKSSSGLVKAIVVSGDRIFTGHQDGKIRIWRVSGRRPSSYKRAGTLPRVKDLIKSSMNPNNYVRGRNHRNSIWLRHFDAISCLSLDADRGLLYSGSWDKTLKVWRLSDARCMESIPAHDDAVNSVVAGYDGVVLTGSADGTVKVWRRQDEEKRTRHTMIQTLLKQECAVTVLARDSACSVLYCGSSDGLVNFWERGRRLCHGGVLRGHKLAILCLATARDLLFTGSADKTICLWRRDQGAHTCLSVLTGHAGPVKCLAVEEAPDSSADDRRYVLYSGSLDKSVKIWRISDLSPAPEKHTSGAQPPASSRSSNPPGKRN